MAGNGATIMLKPSQGIRQSLVFGSVRPVAHERKVRAPKSKVPGNAR